MGMRIYPAHITEQHTAPLGDPRHSGDVFMPPGGVAPLYTRDFRREPGSIPVDPTDVARALQEMQATVPLGWCDSLEIWCLPGVISSFDHQRGTWSLSSAAQTPSSRLMVLSARPRPPADWVQLIGHELGHVFDHLMLPGDRELPRSTLALQLCQVAGIPTGEEHANRADVPWSRRWSERLAEYFMHALWGRPMHPAIPALDPERADALREMLLAVLGSTWAQVEVVGVAPPPPATRVIQLRIGDQAATVDGQTVALDAPAMLVPPGRTMVPLRFVAEALGCRVDWDGARQIVTITQEVRER